VVQWVRTTSLLIKEITIFVSHPLLKVTGSSAGLGKALVEAVLAANERVVATLRNPSALSGLQPKYPASQLLILPLDVSSSSQITDAFQATRKHFGRLDVVVNNAGYGLFGEIEATSDEEARKQIEVLFWGPVNITKQVCSSADFAAPTEY
jgi:NAD(P)-dependent dehydrogenase (short-subunit alcohol dehydrogenase family)